MQQQPCGGGPPGYEYVDYPPDYGAPAPMYWEQQPLYYDPAYPAPAPAPVYGYPGLELGYPGQAEDAASKRKRRRVITYEQRKAANVRERKRMCHLNDAFDTLRKRVPTFAYEKKLSRIETLKLAVTYIQYMAELLEDIQKPGQPSPTSSESDRSEDTPAPAAPEPDRRQ